MKMIINMFKELKAALAQLDASFDPLCLNQGERLTSLRKDLNRKQSTYAKSLSEVLPGFGGNRVSVEQRVTSAMAIVEKEQEEINSKKLEAQRRVESINSTMAAKTSVLNKMNAVLQELEAQSKGLKKEIDGRFIIESMWKFIFGDPERARLSEIDSDIKQRCKERKEVEAERDKIRNDLSTCEKELAECNSALSSSSKRLRDCADRLSKLRKLMKLEDEIEYLKLQIVELENQVSQSNIHAHEGRNAALKKVDQLCKDVRKEQQQLAKCTSVDFGKSENPSDMLAFGRIRLSHGNEKIGFIPRLVPFPLKAALAFDTSVLGREWILDFLLRVFQSIPPSQISITAIDPMELGKSLPDCQILLKNKVPFPAQRILTRGDEIEEALSSLLSYVEHLSQKVFVSGITSWKDYNQKNPKNPLPYKLLVVFDLPEQISDKSALYLSRLVEHGPRCGVLPLLAYNVDKLDERKHSGLLDALSKYSWKNNEIYRHSSMTSLWRNLQFSEEPEPPVREEQLREIFAKLEEKFRVAGSFSGTMEDLWSSCTPWSESAAEGLVAEVGWTSEGNMPVEFRIGDNPTHALLGGSTGSGKSNFLHVLIHSLCHRYSPEELNLYLLDYKEGVEFNCYAEPQLPHARLVAIESDVEYGIAVLQHLCEEHHRRSALFKKLGVRDYRAFRNQGLGKLPRVVVIIDEFQRLFEGGRTFAEGADVLLKTLLKQARSSGIHLILATQTVRGLQNQSVGELLSNLGCRMALSCPAEDSAILLGSGNTEAETLQKQRDGIINLENGVKSANVKFFIPYADENVRLKKMNILVRKALEMGLSCQHTIFRGNALPEMPGDDVFCNVAQGPGISLLLGRMHDFDSQPFFVDVTQGGVLVAGFDQKIRNGLIASMIASLNHRKDAAVIFYSPKESSDLDGISLPESFIIKDSTWDFSDLDGFVNANPNAFLIINTYDYARRISPPAGYRRTDAPESPWDILKRVSDPLNQAHARVILFVENYRRFANSAKELFNLFNLRIGFGLDEDDAGSLVSSGAIAKLKGLQGMTKAVFVDRAKGGVAQFVRPFVRRGSE